MSEETGQQKRLETLRRELKEFLDDAAYRIENDHLLDAANALQRAGVTCRLIDQVNRMVAAKCEPVDWSAA